jgi:hypothetical protein
MHCPFLTNVNATQLRKQQKNEPISDLGFLAKFFHILATQTIPSQFKFAHYKDRTINLGRGILRDPDRLGSHRRARGPPAINTLPSSMAIQISACTPMLILPGPLD